MKKRAMFLFSCILVSLFLVGGVNAGVSFNDVSINSGSIYNGEDASGYCNFTSTLESYAGLGFNWYKNGASILSGNLTPNLTFSDEFTLDAGANPDAFDVYNGQYYVANATNTSLITFMIYNITDSGMVLDYESDPVIFSGKTQTGNVLNIRVNSLGDVFLSESYRGGDTGEYTRGIAVYRKNESDGTYYSLNESLTGPCRGGDVYNDTYACAAAGGSVHFFRPSGEAYAESSYTLENCSSGEYRAVSLTDGYGVYATSEGMCAFEYNSTSAWTVYNLTITDVLYTIQIIGGDWDYVNNLSLFDCGNYGGICGLHFNGSDWIHFNASGGTAGRSAFDSAGNIYFNYKYDYNRRLSWNGTDLVTEDQVSAPSDYNADGVFVYGNSTYWLYNTDGGENKVGKAEAGVYAEGEKHLVSTLNPGNYTVGDEITFECSVRERNSLFSENSSSLTVSSAIVINISSVSISPDYVSFAQSIFGYCTANTTTSTSPIYYTGSWFVNDALVLAENSTPGDDLLDYYDFEVQDMGVGYFSQFNGSNSFSGGDNSIYNVSFDESGDADVEETVINISGSWDDGAYCRASWAAPTNAGDMFVSCSYHGSGSYPRGEYILRYNGTLGYWNSKQKLSSNYFGGVSYSDVYTDKIFFSSYDDVGVLSYDSGTDTYSRTLYPTDVGNLAVLAFNGTDGIVMSISGTTGNVQKISYDGTDILKDAEIGNLSELTGASASLIDLCTTSMLYRGAYENGRASFGCSNLGVFYVVHNGTNFSSGGRIDAPANYVLRVDDYGDVFYGLGGNGWGTMKWNGTAYDTIFNYDYGYSYDTDFNDFIIKNDYFYASIKTADDIRRLYKYEAATSSVNSTKKVSTLNSSYYNAGDNVTFQCSAINADGISNTLNSSQETVGDKSVVITFPENDIVVQRGANFSIQGTYSNVDTVTLYWTNKGTLESGSYELALSGGNISGSLNLSAGEYNLTFVDGDSLIEIAQDMGVGDVIMVIGQSNAGNSDSAGLTYGESVDNLIVSYAIPGGFCSGIPDADAATFSDYTFRDYTAAERYSYAIYQTSYEEDIPMMVLLFSSGGSSSAQWLQGDTLCYPVAKRGVELATGGTMNIRFIYWNQGETDVATTTYEDYLANIVNISSAYFSELNVLDSNFLVSQTLRTGADPTTVEANLTNIRRAQQDSWDLENLSVGTVYYDQEWEAVHPDGNSVGSEKYVFAQRIAGAFLGYGFGNSTYTNPQVTNIYRYNDTRIYVKYDRSNLELSDWDYDAGSSLYGIDLYGDSYSANESDISSFEISGSYVIIDFSEDVSSAENYSQCVGLGCYGLPVIRDNVTLMPSLIVYNESITYDAEYNCEDIDGLYYYGDSCHGYPQGEEGTDVDEDDCEADSDCPDCYYCSIASGKCMVRSTVGCATHEDCAAGYNCTGCECVREETGCLSDSDCPEGYECKDSSCLKIPPTEPEEGHEGEGGDEGSGGDEGAGADEGAGGEQPPGTGEQESEGPNTNAGGPTQTQQEAGVPSASEGEGTEGGLEPSSEPLDLAGATGLALLLIVAGLAYYFYGKKG